MMRSVSALLGTGLAACAATQSEPMDDLKAQAIDGSPLERQIAASNTFYFCKDHPKPERFDALCEVCSVDFYPNEDLPFSGHPNPEAQIVGVKGWATHFYHEYKPRDGDPRPRITVTGERASATFITDDLTVEAIEREFEAANAWCQDRAPGEYRLLKNEIETFVAGLPS